MEIIAVYWEPKIKTYGFQVRTDCLLASAALSIEQIIEWGEQIERGGGKSDFLMALIQMDDQDTLGVHLLFDRDRDAEASPVTFNHAKGPAGIEFSLNSPVDLIYFQGPHFGDRYGIADAALRALAARSIPVLAAGFTGASVYIVVADKQARDVTRCLSEFFTVPEATGL